MAMKSERLKPRKRVCR